MQHSLWISLSSGTECGYVTKRDIYADRNKYTYVTRKVYDRYTDRIEAKLQKLHGLIVALREQIKDLSPDAEGE